MNDDLITFEQDLTRIEDIVNQLSAGTVGLNDAVALYEESVARLRHARDLLDKAELALQSDRRRKKSKADTCADDLRVSLW